MRLLDCEWHMIVKALVYYGKQHEDKDSFCLRIACGIQEHVSGCDVKGEVSYVSSN